MDFLYFVEFFLDFIDLALDFWIFLDFLRCLDFLGFLDSFQSY